MNLGEGEFREGHFDQVSIVEVGRVKGLLIRGNVESSGGAPYGQEALAAVLQVELGNIIGHPVGKVGPAPCLVKTNHLSPQSCSDNTPKEGPVGGAVAVHCIGPHLTDPNLFSIRGKCGLYKTSVLFLIGRREAGNVLHAGETKNLGSGAPQEGGNQEVS
jgi:hypothetical protein